MRCMFLGRECDAAAWCNVTTLVSAVINLNAEPMSQYCRVQAWLTTIDGWWHFTELCFSFSENRCWFIAVCVCACATFIFRLLFIDTAFQTLKLDAEDSSGRQHILTVKLKSKVRHTQKPTRPPCRAENCASTSGVRRSSMLTRRLSQSRQADFPQTHGGCSILR